MKREVSKLTKNTYYIDMEEYFGMDSIKRISEKEKLTGEELTKFLYDKLLREFKIFLISKMTDNAVYDENGYCKQILIIEYNELTWLIEVISNQYIKHHNKKRWEYFDTYSHKYYECFVGEEKDELVTDTKIREIKREE